MKIIAIALLLFNASGSLCWKIKINRLQAPLVQSRLMMKVGSAAKVATSAPLPDQRFILNSDITSLINNIPLKIEQTLISIILSSSIVQKILSFFPPFIKKVFVMLYPADLFLFIFFQLTYTRMLRFAHTSQIVVWRMLALGTPYEWNKSILGFTEQRCGLLAKLVGCNYIVKLVCSLLAALGLNIRADFPPLLSSISYTLYVAQFIDQFKMQFLHTFFSSIAESRRQSYVVNRFSSVIIWIVTGLIACEMVSTYLKVPLSSTLAFGGVGGLAIGLSARDIAANFLGGTLHLV